MIDAVLERLCERAGIATRYADIWGREHRPPEATLRALLSSLGLAGTDDAEATLARMEEREWRNGLPAVWVCHEDGAHLRVRVTLPAAASGATLRWRLETEDGTVRTGELPPGARSEIERRRVGSTEWVAAWCVVPQRPGLGYHHLSLHAPVGPGAPWHAQTTLVVAPRQCYRPPALAGDGRTWGLCSQLYALRSSRNWGIGDFTDLLRLVELAADAGAGMVGVSPLHALFPHNPAHASPYSPSSRHFLNVLHLDVEAIPEFARCDEAQARVAAQQDGEAGA